MWVKKSPVELSTKSSIKDRLPSIKQLLLELFGILVFGIIYEKIHTIKGRGVVEKSWQKVLDSWPAIAILTTILFVWLNAYRIFKANKGMHLCTKCDKLTNINELKACECGTLYVNSNDYKWIEVPKSPRKGDVFDDEYQKLERIIKSNKNT